MRGPLKTRARDAASTRSDTFLAQTFGNVSFTSMWVEEVTQLRVVESGAFDGSEGTLTKITFTWNYALTSFPFSDVSCKAVSMLALFYLLSFIFVLHLYISSSLH